MPVIELQDVRKVYRSGALEVEAVRGVSLAIETGEYEIGRASCRERV